MKIDTDRLLRVVWLVNGIVLLLFLLVSGAFVITNVVRNLGADDAAVRIASRPAAQPPRPRAVRYQGLQPIPGTATRIAYVHHGEAYETNMGLSGSGRAAGPVVNAVFVDADGSARLLLDRPAYIAHVRLPGQDRRGTGATWLAFEMAVDDGNGDRVLDSRDPTTLWVTGLDGRNPRRVLPAGLRYAGHEVYGAGRLLVTALEGGEKGADASRLRQRAFIYEVASGRLAPHAALDSAVARAGALLGR